MTIIDKLQILRSQGGESATKGLPDEQLLDFAARDPRLEEAVDAALAGFEQLKQTDSALLAKDEAGQVADIQTGYINFTRKMLSVLTSAWRPRGPGS